MEVPSLSLDPIGQFLTARHPAGTSEEMLEQDRARLERFRHNFPGLSLQRLGPSHVVEYVDGLEQSGHPPAVVQVTSELCEAFIRFAQREPDLGSGLLRLPDVGENTRGEDPFMMQRATPVAAAAGPTNTGGGGWIVWLIMVLFFGGVGAAVYLFAL